jgi:hypothetical protein
VLVLLRLRLHQERRPQPAEGPTRSASSGAPNLEGGAVSAEESPAVDDRVFTVTILIVGNDNAITISGVLSFEAGEHGYFLATEEASYFYPWANLRTATFVADSE